jgi:hypothetical protein
VRRGPRSARLLVRHPAPAAAPPAYRPGGPVHGFRPWAERSHQPRAVGVASVSRIRERRRALARRAWAWRLLLTAWFALTAMTLWLAVRWIGLAGLGCPALMAILLLVLSWCAVDDLRDMQREMRDGR